MRPGDPLIIERTANGWLVRVQTMPNDIACIADFRVFQHLQYDQLGVQSELTVFGFLDQHFAASQTTKEPKDG